LAALEAGDEILWRIAVEVPEERSTVVEDLFVATAWLCDGEGVAFSEGLELGGRAAVLSATRGDAEWVVLDGTSRWKVQYRSEIRTTATAPRPAMTGIANCTPEGS
jgi:hypothetical protein